MLQAVDKPDSAERWLLTSQLSQLHECLRPGLTHLNWHALGIQDFVTPIYKVMPIPQFSEREPRLPSNAKLGSRGLPCSSAANVRYLGPVTNALDDCQ